MALATVNGQTICTSLQTDNHARQAKLRDPTLTCAILGAFVESQTQCKELHEYPVYCAVHILCVALHNRPLSVKSATAGHVYKNCTELHNPGANSASYPNWDRACVTDSTYHV